MRKRASTMQLGAREERPWGDISLCSEISTGQDTPTSEPQAKVDLDTHAVDARPPSLMTGNISTPSLISDVEWGYLEEQLRGMRVTDRDSYLSQFTNCSQSPENTEERYGRKVAVPMYGTDNHRYHLPVDEEEVERLAIGHVCWASTTRLLYVQPPPGIHLDLGAGCGSWVQDMAETKPDCIVIGIDLLYHDVPETPNQAAFELDDCEQPFAERSDTVTLINMRDSFLWVRDLQVLVTRVHSILGRGSFFQSQEIRLTEWDNNKPHICRWKNQVLECAGRLGIQLHTVSDMRQALVGNGFVEYGGERIIWTFETTERLREFAKLTIKASIGILSDAMGQSTAIDDIVSGAMEDVAASDCWIKVGVDICWAKKILA